MTRRAILLVPGFGRRERLSARDQLVQSLLDYTPGWDTRLTDAPNSGDLEVAAVLATGRAGQGNVTLEVAEAYWGDLIPDWSHESPFARFRRGSTLVAYWMTGGLIKAIAKRDNPPMTTWTMVFAGLALILWYLVVVALLIEALAGGTDTLPDWMASALDALGLDDNLTGWATAFSAWPVVVFVLGLTGLGFVERIANVAAFAKAYLRDDPVEDKQSGIRSKTRARVVRQLDAMHARTGDEAYDEIYVVAHSLGGAMALDALADYGERLSKITLLTWGTALGTLAQREPLVEDEIRKFYSVRTRIAHWVDVVFRGDLMGSRVPVPRRMVDGKPVAERMRRVFPPPVTPHLPRGAWLRLSDVHDGYYRCETAMVMVVQTADELRAAYPAPDPVPAPAPKLVKPA